MIRHRFEHLPIPLTTVRAPHHLNFVRNPEEVCRFIAQLRECFDKRKPVFVHLKDVEEIDYDGITVLLSVMVRFRAKKIPFNGNFPRDPEIHQLLKDSDFFDHLYYSDFSDTDTYELTGKNSILTHAMRRVDSVLGERIIKAASQTVWGEPRRCRGVQRTLIELMQNTNNHASLEREGEKHWWLSVKHLQEENRVAFSFVDYGVGVFQSLKSKTQSKKWFGALDYLKALFSTTDNAELLRLIFNGELHKTASGKPYRGKGLPGIYEALLKNKISNLSMVTNDVFFNSESNEYRTLLNNFEGTFIYWELCLDNSSLPYAP